MLTFVVIGMLCNSQQCYWAMADVAREPVVFPSYESCKASADRLRANSIMFFKTDCMVKP
jgi:hypothetical protein